jgi:hypothetical protein
LNAQEQAQISQLARNLGDVKAPEVQQGYVAQRHQLIPELILVWASCGCYWAGGTGGTPFVTPCGLENCNFEWSGIEGALLALEQAERPRDAEASIHVLSAPVAVPDGTSSPQTTPALEGPTALDELVEAMISEGGPVDVPMSEVPEKPKQ